MPHYLNPDLTYNRAAIMRAAWAKAHHWVKVDATSSGPFKACITTARSHLSLALRDVWDLALNERGTAVWKAEREAGFTAEAARRAALPVCELQIEDAQVALMFAEHADTFSAANNDAITGARARLASLQQAA